MTRALFFFALTTWYFATPSLAAATNSDSYLELTPLVHYRIGGEFNDDISSSDLSLADKAGIGLIIAWPYDNGRQAELLISHNQTEFDDRKQITSDKNSQIDVSYLHLGGNVKLNQQAVAFYLSGGLGVTYLKPNDNRFNNETAFSMNLGLSSTVEITDHTKFYMTGRVYGTWMDSEGEIFCDNQQCRYSITTNLWLQTELAAGISFRF